jgi:hypothetical protein
VTAEAEVPAGEMTIYQPSGDVAEYRPRIVMPADEAKAMDTQLREMMRGVLTEDTDYGTIPGSSKPSLWKPGAEKLLQWFGFGHTHELAEVERDYETRARVGATYRCTVTKSMPDGRDVTVATCEGYAGYDEDQFFQTLEQARAKAEAKERANAARYKRAVNPEKWQFATEYRAPWNTVLKMAQKRALVGAALAATSASTLFTQDLEDAPGSPSAGGGDGAAFAAEATKLIGAMPDAVRNELDAWFRGKGWGGPGTWSAGQWCEGLVQAGRLSAGPAPATPAPAAPETEAAPAAEPGGDGQEWLAEARASVPSLDAAGLNRLRTEAQTRHGAKQITIEDVKSLAELIGARRADLTAERLKATQLDPDDSWAARIDEINAPDDAPPVIGELGGLLREKKITKERFDQIRAAVNGRIQMLINQKEAP